MDLDPLRLNVDMHDLFEIEDLRNAGYRFGKILLPTKETAQHFLFVGTTGSGKTTIIRLLMQDALQDIDEGTNARAMFNNPKGDMLPLIKSMAPHVRVVAMDPFDQRGAAWDVAKDIDDSAKAVQFAHTLIGERQESQPFFSDAARHLVRGVMQSFIYRDIDWSIADVVRATTRSAVDLENILLATEVTAYLVPLYFSDKKLLANIIATVTSRFADLEPVVAAWEMARTKVSLRDWAEQEFVIVLGNDETSRTAMDRLNQAMIKTVGDILLNQSESEERTTWIVLDELSDLGKLDLVSVAKKGRSKGCRVCIAFQSVAGLRNPENYGEFGAAELLGQFSNRFFGRLECPDTAKWASEILGDQDYLYRLQNSTVTSIGSSEQLTSRPVFLPSQFLGMPPCTKEDGLTGIYLTRVTDPYMTTIDGVELFEEDLIPPDPRVPDRVCRPREAQLLRPWTDEQRAYFAPPQRRPGTKAADVIKDLNKLG